MQACGGSIEFVRFMEIALYQPGLGYYVSGAPKLGQCGDYITAPELGDLFANCVARQCAQVLDAIGGGDILEGGAGSGALAAGVLNVLEQRDSLPHQYQILEVSPVLRVRQRQTLEQRVPHLLHRVRWIEEQVSPGFRGVMLANELLDAMPAVRFHVESKGFAVAHVALEGDGFGWRKAPAHDAATQCMQERLGSRGLPTGYRSEIALQAEAWVRTLGRALAKGVMLIIDYGFPRHEFYHPQRVDGTLMCHYRHRAHDDPLILVGLQDITVHVDFSALAHAALEADLDVYGYTQLAPFLMSLGLLELIDDAGARPVQYGLALTQQVKKLTLPSEMGELYKVIALGRGVDVPLMGFQMQDHRARL